jgi:hypothetical protein
MNVRDLIEMLQDYDEDAEVFIMEQPNWPFEYSVIGVISTRCPRSPHPSGWGGIGLSRKLFMLISLSPDVCFA